MRPLCHISALFLKLTIFSWEIPSVFLVLNALELLYINVFPRTCIKKGYFKKKIKKCL